MPPDLPPNEFVDACDRRWRLCLHLPLASRVRKCCPDVDLLDPFRPALWEALQHPATLVTVLAVLLDDDLQARQITPEDFAAGLYGDVLDRATDALTQAIVDFFPQRQRPVLQAARDRTLAAIERAADRMTDRLLSAETQREIDRKIEAALRSPAMTSAPKSSTAAAGSDSIRPAPF